MGSPRGPLGSPKNPRDHPGTSRDLPGTPQGAPGTPRDPLKTPFRNGNGHISTPVRRKSLLTIAFESSRRDLQLVSHWHCRKVWKIILLTFLFFFIVAAGAFVPSNIIKTRETYEKSCLYILGQVDFRSLFLKFQNKNAHKNRFCSSGEFEVIQPFQISNCLSPFSRDPLRGTDLLRRCHIYIYIYIYMYIYTYIYIHI